MHRKLLRICAGTDPHLRRDWPTSAPGLAHICSGTPSILVRDGAADRGVRSLAGRDSVKAQKEKYTDLRAFREIVSTQVPLGAAAPSDRDTWQ